MYFNSFTQATVSHNRFDISRPHYWTCLSDIVSSFIMLRLHRNHSAINTLHVPTQPYTTTYQPYCSHRDLTRRSLLGRNLPLNLAVLTDWIPSFPRLRLPVYFDAAYLQDLCINNLPTCRDCLCASLGVAEGEGFEPPNRLNDCRVSGAVLST